LGDPSNPCTPTQLTPGPNTDANGVDLAAKAYLPFWHLPNGPILGNGDVGVFTFAGQQIVHENVITTRLDHKLSENDSLFPTYLSHWSSMQYCDDAFLSRATGCIRFRVAAARMLMKMPADSAPNGIWRFADRPAFLPNGPKKFHGEVTSTLSPRNVRQNLIA